MILVIVVLALLAILGTDLAASFSVTPDDTWSAIAPGVKAASYGLVLAGLLAGMHQAFRSVRSARDQAIAGQDALRANEEALKGRIGDLEEAHETLAQKCNLLTETANDLSAARAKAEQANRAKSRHLATISHEIRTPLNGVLGMAQLLLRTPLDDVQRRYVETVISSGKTQLAILNDVLDLSRITANKLNVAEAPFDPRKVAESVVDLMAGSKQSSDVDLCVRSGQSVPDQILGDEGRFRQILTNLVGNALKFTERGGVTVFLEARAPAARSDAIELRCRVEDTGVGIAAADQGLLFGEFVQADESAQRLNGTGLGLSICKKLCELMGGTIGVESAPGQGSCFWFYIAVRRAPENAQATGPHAAQLPSLAGQTVLVALENHASADAVADYLGRCGADVRRCAANDRDDGGCADDLTFVDAKAWRLRPRHGPGTLVLVAMSRNDVGLADAWRFRGMIRQPVSQSTVAEGLNALLRLAEPDIMPATGARTGMKILVADDNAMNRELVRAVLDRAGYDVTVTGDGATAVQRFAAEHFDLVLMDLQMPQMDGCTASRKIRSKGGWGATVPIIALTASPMTEAQPRCCAAGMDECVTKPFERNALLRLIAEAVETSRAEAKPATG